MDIVGRKREISDLRTYYDSGRPELIAIYGRRRVGKTFLINMLFGDEFAFSVTGMANGTKKDQLKNFNIALNKYSGKEYEDAADWIDAFQQLADLLENIEAGKRQVIFIDELPWFDTHKSKFLMALEHFWNSWAAMREDIFLVVCGSATSWIINKLINNKGGLHNRVTRQMKLDPYTLAECEEFFKANNIELNRHQILESYMIFGGIPYYLSLFDKRESLVQNVNRLCFASDGQLKNEFDRLYASLFSDYERHLEIVRALNKRLSGMTREEIILASGLADGGNTTRALAELELSGFLRKYHAFGKKSKGAVYQLVDFFSLFHMKFMSGKNVSDETFWLKYSNTPAHNAWSGYAYELVCLTHIEQIKRALGISGIGANVASWRSSAAQGGAQIDLVIGRADKVINLCEIKYSDSEFSIDKSYDLVLRNKRNAFASETKTRKAIHQTMITTYGLAHNEYRGSVQSEITFDDLFAED
jgi:hypothetical protein